MCIKAIRLTAEADEDLRFRILAEIVGDARGAVRVSFPDLAKKFKISRQLVSYHVKKLVEAGYLRGTPEGYAPTDRILILPADKA